MDRNGAERERRRTRRRLTALRRFQVMQWIRAAAVLLVMLALWRTPDSLQPYTEALLRVTLGFSAAGVLAGLLVATAPARALRTLRTLRVMLVVDAVWLCVGAYLSGGAASPLHYAILLHLGAVTLLASYRTGLVMALLDTGLLLGLRGAVSLGWLPETAPAEPGSPTERLGIFLVVLWIVAVTTAVLARYQEKERRRRRHDLQALTALTERVEHSADPATVAQTLLESVVSSYDLRRGVVLASQDGSLPLLAAYGLPPGVVAAPGRPGTSAVVARAQAEEATQAVTELDPEADEWLARLFGRAGTLLVVPLSMDSRSIGAVVVEFAGRPRSQRSVVAGLERSATYGALSLRNAWLLAGVQRLAATDSLTKIANRRSFEQTLERELARGTRANEYVSLVMVDIDHFKGLNDTLGHQGGDDVLRNVAAALAMACREFDTPARYGGEEFAVILPGVGPEEAIEIAERLRMGIAAAPTPVPITASAGVATYPAHAADLETLVRAADEALYISKRAGRDRTTISEGVPPEEQVHALIRRAVRARMKGRESRSETEALSSLYDSPAERS
jgi:diguanylate cyclase (GGDEF)-like protein